MIIQVARESDAPAMGRVMVATYLAAHRDQMPAEAWAKRAREWTPEVSAHGWARTLRAIAAGDCSSKELNRPRREAVAAVELENLVCLLAPCPDDEALNALLPCYLEEPFE
jgi:hypothetical protein